MNKKLEDLKEFEEKINYKFKNRNYLISALTHSSYANEVRIPGIVNNERLEFLGDAVLELATSAKIFKKYPNMSEGKMSKYRASIVCEPTLASCSKAISLSDYIFLGNGEELTGGRERASIVSDAFEALIGALYLDGGIDVATEFINTFVLNDIVKHHLFYDSKSILQEIVQSLGKELEYREISQTGPQHNKTFTVECVCNGYFNVQAVGPTKKKAQQSAAYNAILLLKEKGIFSDESEK